MNVLVHTGQVEAHEAQGNPPVALEGELGYPLSGARAGQGLEDDTGEGRGMSSEHGIATSWQFKRLGSLAQIKGGKRLPKGAKLLTEPTPFPYIRVCDFNAFSVDLNDMHYLTPAIQEKISQYIITKEDVFISIAGTIGRVGTIPEALHGANLTENAARIVLVGDGLLDKEFLKYCLASPEIQNDIMSRRSKNAQPKLALTQIKDLEIPLPPLPEQKKIAHFLSTVQRAIDAQERIIQTTSELKKALMHKLFTEGLRNEPQKHTVIGPVPKSWEVVELGQVINLFAGYAFKSKEGVPDSNTQLLRMGNLYQNTLDLNRSPIFYPDSFADTYRRFVLDEGDLVMSLTGTSGKEDYGFTVRIPDTGKKLLLNQRVTRIDIIDHRLQKDFVHHFLLSRKFLNFLYPTAKGMKQANLSTNAMKKLKVALPLEEEQSAIAKCFNSLDQKIVVAGHKSTALQDLFHTFLYELMTAKIRVHELEFKNQEVLNLQ